MVSGLVTLEGEQWAKRRKIINPAFHLEKLNVIFNAQFPYQNILPQFPCIFFWSFHKLWKWTNSSIIETVPQGSPIVSHGTDFIGVVQPDLDFFPSLISQLGKKWKTAHSSFMVKADKILIKVKQKQPTLNYNWLNFLLYLQELSLNGQFASKLVMPYTRQR